MPTDLSLRLAEQISSRLCHDLITPIGAINTGLELLQENPAEHLKESDEILNLILHSAQTASARLSFFRIAFGSSAANLSLGEAKQLVENFFMRTKLTVNWGNPFDSKLPLGDWSKLLLGSILWLSECAPRGGVIELMPLKTQNSPLRLTLKAESIILHQGTLETLEGKLSIDAVTPRTIGCYILKSLVEQMNGSLSVRQVDSPPELILELKRE